MTFPAPWPATATSHWAERQHKDSSELFMSSPWSVLPVKFFPSWHEHGLGEPPPSPPRQHGFGANHPSSKIKMRFPIGMHNLKSFLHTSPHNLAKIWRYPRLSFRPCSRRICQKMNFRLFASLGQRHTYTRSRELKNR